MNLLVDEPELAPARPTDDVDVVIEMVTQRDYAQIEERLRKLGFSHDVREGAPKCRWTLKNLTVDIMPVGGEFLGLNTDWFSEALASALPVDREGATLQVVSPIAFLVTKYVAFLDRGGNDFYSSQDLEDMISVIDGRASIVAELKNSETNFRRFLGDSVKALLVELDFRDALPGHLLGDAASQARLPDLMKKLEGMAVG